ncbi:acyl-CoA dehydrogenase family protein [Desulfatibacillum aliphaticivorans]|uniref:Acyl-CoA dehydrogenase domain protein n=1 Tax=Desulfatibacillum aliphaticivorans TaxID=218208 RepID=B8FIW4_DESAL|nr:acyl-CoA dehydrogenase family protein [Desulfatibacillum aliphaticivorans]ACL04355.1 Acyl-CoA dehydrogenase domain protein [Desulfatibacillum aliphaticivorans]
MTTQNIKTADQMYFTKEHDLVRKSVRDFVKKEIAPNLDEWEETGETPLHALFKKMGDLGFLGIRYDPKYGGQGLDYWYELVFLEELAHIQGLGLPVAIAVQTHMATPAIYEFGSEYLKETYLVPAIAGDMVTSIAVTEPGAGSDVSALATTAKKDGDHYVINGSKTYITNGTQADYLTLLARTSDDPGYHSFSLFVVPTNLPGFQVSKKLDKLGMRSSDTAELFFDDVRIPKENLIGREGEGFIYQMQQFQHERFSAIPGGYIVAKDIIDLTLDYIKGRVVFGKPLIKRELLQHRLAQWLTEIECLKSLTYHIVQMKMAGLECTREISMGKLKAAKVLQGVAADCIQMFGGMGFMNEALITRFYRDARIISVGGGADEVMCQVIARLEGF